jgi:hypothetical protein
VRRWYITHARQPAQEDSLIAFNSLFDGETAYE